MPKCGQKKRHGLPLTLVCAEIRPRKGGPNTPEPDSISMDGPHQVKASYGVHLKESDFVTKVKLN